MSRKPIFQQENTFPQRYIVRPNLVKARVFRSGKNTPKETDNDERGVRELYDGTFNIEDVLSGKARRKSKGKNVQSTTFENINFNPFGPNTQKKKLRENLNQSVSKSNLIVNKQNRDISNINRSQQDITNEIKGDLNEDEYKKQVEFYEKILKDNNEENDSYYVENDKQIHNHENHQRNNYIDKTNNETGLFF